MSLKAGLAALEEEPVETEEVPAETEEILEDIVEAGENETEVVEVMEEIEDMEDAEGEFTEATEQLMTLRDSIEKYGLCKAQISAVNDPEGFLFSSGIIPAFESLNDLPTKNEVSEASVEAINQKVKDTVDKVIKFIKAMWEKLKNMFKKIFDLVRSYANIIKGLENTIKLGSYDDAKLSKIETNYPTAKGLIAAETENGSLRTTITGMAGLDSHFSAFTSKISGLMKSDKAEEITSAMETIEGEWTKFCDSIKAESSMTGVSVSKDGGKTTIKVTKPGIFKGLGTKTSMKTGGWNKDSILKALGKAASDAVSMKELEKAVKDLDKNYADLCKDLKELGTSAKNPIVAAATKKALDVAKRIADGKRSIVNRCIANTYLGVKTAIYVARASLPALTKK